MRVAVLSLGLVACSPIPYWQASGRAPVEVKHIVSVDCPCGLYASACANLAGQTIELDRRFTPVERSCVIGHERRHFAGDDHATSRPTVYAYDCGNGDILPITDERARVLGRAARCTP